MCRSEGLEGAHGKANGAVIKCGDASSATTMSRASEGVKGKIPVRLEDQLMIAKVFDDKRRFAFGFGLGRYAVYELLARVFDVIR